MQIIKFNMGYGAELSSLCVTAPCKNSASALCQKKGVFPPLRTFEKGQKLIKCRVAPLTEDRSFAVRLVTSKRDSVSAAAPFITSHSSPERANVSHFSEVHLQARCIVFPRAK